jgi:DNA-binding NarL/FixJ family response regulator
MKPYRIVLADDHLMLRQGLKRILAEGPDLEVIGEAGDGLELIRLLRKSPPDLVILDVSMPYLRGLEAIREMKSIHPGVKILILTMHKDKEYLHQAMAEGAHGYLLKEDADTELFSAIKMLRQGEFYLSPAFSRGLAEDWVKALRDKDTRPPSETLTLREREILKLIAEGKANKEISELLSISVRTVEHHRANIMEKLQLHSTAELVKYAMQKGFV